MGTIGAYPTATDGTDDDVLIGNDGTLTRKFPLTVIRSYAQATVVTSTKTSSYTAALDDAGKLIIMDSVAANNFTISSTIAFSVGTVIDVLQYNVGATSIVASGVTISKPPSRTLTIAERYGMVTLIKVSSTEWVAAGLLA